MHERTRRTLCRLAFLLLGIFPPGFVFTILLYRSTPLYSAAECRRWENAIFQRCGLIASIERVSHPKRGRTMLQRVELKDPEGGRPVAKVRVLELARTDHGQVILASQPEVHEGQFLRLCEALHERILRGPPLETSVQISAQEITLKGESSQTFTDVHGTLEQREEGMELLVDFRVAGVEMPSAAQIQLMRNRQVQPPATGWSLRTGDAPLPCSLLADYLPALRRLGPSCRFQGSVWADRSTSDWNGEIAGRFTNVDLDRLIEPFPHKLSGTARLEFRRASFRGGRLKEAAGSIEADAGTISRSLITELSRAMKLNDQVARDGEPAQLLAYSHLSLGYELLDTGLRVTGMCRPAPPGTILLGQQGPLLTDGGAKTVPAVSLAQALSPDSRYLVPATRESDTLVRTLPVPSRSSSRALQAKRQYVPLRLRKE